MVRSCFVLAATLAAACAPRSPSPEPWAVTAEGAGPVHIGMTPAQLEAALRVTLPSSTGECEYVKPPGIEGLLIMVADGSVARIDVIAPGLRTANGIGVGTTEEAVRAAYPPEAVRAEKHKYVPDGHTLSINLELERRLVLDTDGARVTRYRVGRMPEVDWVEGCA